MATEQSAANSKREAMTDGARYVVAELVREPVKEAVREALAEEAVAVRDREGETEAGRSGPDDRTEPADRSTSDGSDDGGGSKVGLLLLSVAATGAAAYLVRKRRSDTEQSTWSEFEEEQQGGGRARTEDGRTEHTPGSTGTGSARAGESAASPGADE
ncbi:hypothetical protein [Halosimplex halophilum]|uniref:hypothetical protein n=1 Tax=Halosimplex halophilum TaxID=2559572 RepID=UPI00107FC1C5|nr:hypothetical protein [Halosimplex halophilum]